MKIVKREIAAFLLGMFTVLAFDAGYALVSYVNSVNRKVDYFYLYVQKLAEQMETK